MGPATKLDLRDQGRLGEHQVLALERHGRFTCLQPVERLAQILGILRIKPGSDGADVNPVMPFATGEAAKPSAVSDCS